MHPEYYRKIGGEDHLVTKGKLFNEATNRVSDGTFALRFAALDAYRARGQGTKWVQLRRLVLPALIHAKHIFKGLRRDLYNDDDAHADEKNLVYTWKPGIDVEWDRSLNGGAGGTVDLPAPIGAVFAVTVGLNERHKDRYPEIDAFIGAWNWIDGEDAVLAEAPIEWVDRYDRKLWTRSET